MINYSFCESQWATGTSPWHIRRLTKLGKKLSGGADTPALCGRKVAWDLEVDITEHHLTHCCICCREEYYESTNKITGSTIRNNC